jgi:rare lipoprotein A
LQVAQNTRWPRVNRRTLPPRNRPVRRQQQRLQLNQGSRARRVHPARLLRSSVNPPFPANTWKKASRPGTAFNGRRTSNGEIYDMHEFTAAHRTLPFNCVVRVTNLSNGKHTEVRINDRGPFVANRVIDLSLSAAQAIEMVGTGTANVRLEILSGPNPNVGFFAVQIGAFKVQENAERLKAQMQETYPPVTIATYDSPNGTFYRVRVGRLPSEAAAQSLADKLHDAEQMTTFVVRLDD